MSWRKHLDDSWFRECDFAYAGKDHTKTNSTFICIFHDEKQGVDIERRGFKTLSAAKAYVDNNAKDI